MEIVESLMIGIREGRASEKEGKEMVAHAHTSATASPVATTLSLIEILYAAPIVQPPKVSLLLGWF